MVCAFFLPFIFSTLVPEQDTGKEEKSEQGGGNQFQKSHEIIP